MDAEPITWSTQEATNNLAAELRRVMWWDVAGRRKGGRQRMVPDRDEPAQPSRSVRDQCQRSLSSGARPVVSAVQLQLAVALRGLPNKQRQPSERLPPTRAQQLTAQVRTQQARAAPSSSGRCFMRGAGSVPFKSSKPSLALARTNCGSSSVKRSPRPQQREHFKRAQPRRPKWVHYLARPSVLRTCSPCSGGPQAGQPSTGRSCARPAL